MPDQHKPGPATDALVAEKVMGWKRLGHSIDYWYAADDKQPSGYRLMAHVPAFRPTTDIAVAWEVHQKMQERILSVRQRYYREVQRAVQQRLDLVGWPLWPGVFGLLKPEDICLAALAVVESEADDAAEAAKGGE